MKPMNEEHLAILRRHMVEVIAIHADVMSDETGKATLDGRVLMAMLQVPRHLFVPMQLAHVAYHDMPLPIGFDKTISQPFISALMTDLLSPEPHEVVLEIGTRACKIVGGWFRSGSIPGSRGSRGRWRNWYGG
jgi:protein-L-isoaspartate(D-aspartate) O-methyltransferase